MKKIASFQVDHTRLLPGMYISRVDGDVVTYDIRFVKPNTPPFLETAAMHTIEHLFATYVRNSALQEGILYFGPMGCRTGFYFLTRSTIISHDAALALVQETLQFIMDFTEDIPGVSAVECGNYREHDLPLARQYAANLACVLSEWSVGRLSY